MANVAEEGLQFELPIELEDLGVAQVTEKELEEIAVDTLRARTEKHNEAVLQKAEDMEGSAKASFIARKFVTGIRNISVVPPGTAYNDVVNGVVVQKATKGYSVACNRTYANGRMSRDIHYPLSV